MNTKAAVLLLALLCASLTRAQEVRIVYELDYEETNGTYTPSYDGSTCYITCMRGHIYMLVACYLETNLLDFPNFRKIRFNS
jgi:hypothetical protein